MGVRINFVVGMSWLLLIDSESSTNVFWTKKIFPRLLYQIEGLIFLMGITMTFVHQLSFLLRTDAQTIFELKSFIFKIIIDKIPWFFRVYSFFMRIFQILFSFCKIYTYWILIYLVLAFHSNWFLFIKSDIFKLDDSFDM